MINFNSKISLKHKRLVAFSSMTAIPGYALYKIITSKVPFIKVCSYILYLWIEFIKELIPFYFSLFKLLKPNVNISDFKMNDPADISLTQSTLC